MGLPGAWIVLLLRAVVVHPAGHDSPSPNLARAAVVFGPFNTLDTRDDISFVAAFPTAHALAHLRIAGRVTATVARLATGWAGSPFAGRVSHPLDDVPNFIRFSPISLLSDQPCLVALNALSSGEGASFIDDAALNDQAWDAVTLYHFTNYMQANVFGPAGVSNVKYSPSGAGGLAYAFPHTGGAGWNSGDLTAVAGGAGFRLSTKELLDVLGAVRRKKTILPAAKAQYLLDNKFGIDQSIETPAGKIYNKNGAWGTGDGKTEQSVAYFMPGGVEVVVFVNSKIGSQGFSLRGLVEDVYKSSLK